MHQVSPNKLGDQQSPLDKLIFFCYPGFVIAQAFSEIDTAEAQPSLRRFDPKFSLLAVVIYILQ